MLDIWSAGPIHFTPIPVCRLGGYIHCRFHMSHGITLFNGISTPVFPVGCDVTLNQSSGRIKSPGHGRRKYAKNLRCVWRITEPEGRPLVMQFHHMATERHYDIVSVSSKGRVRQRAIMAAIHEYFILLHKKYCLPREDAAAGTMLACMYRCIWYNVPIAMYLITLRPVRMNMCFNL